MLHIIDCWTDFGAMHMPNWCQGTLTKASDQADVFGSWDRTEIIFIHELQHSFAKADPHS